MQLGTKFCQIFKGFLDGRFFVLALNLNLLEENTTACVNMGKMLFYSYLHELSRTSVKGAHITGHEGPEGV